MSQAPLTLLRCWAGPKAVSSGVTVPQFLARWDITWLCDMAATAAEIRHNNIIPKMDSKIPSAGAGQEQDLD